MSPENKWLEVGRCIPHWNSPFLEDVRSFSGVHVSDLTWTISKFHTPRTSTVPTLLVVSSVISLKTFMCISSNSSTACDSVKNHLKKRWRYVWLTFFQVDVFLNTKRKTWDISWVLPINTGENCGFHETYQTGSIHQKQQIDELRTL